MLKGFYTKYFRELLNNLNNPFKCKCHVVVVIGSLFLNHNMSSKIILKAYMKIFPLNRGIMNASSDKVMQNSTTAQPVTKIRVNVPVLK